MKPRSAGYVMGGGFHLLGLTLKVGVLTVRFTYRASIIRIIGAGYWRKGKAIYERENAA